MKNLHVVTGISTVLTFLFLTACSSSRAPTAADMMRDYADVAQDRADLRSQLARDWDRGAALLVSGERRVRAGESRIESAEREIRRGRDDIERGNREIAEGQSLLEESERKFREAFPELNLNQEQ